MLTELYCRGLDDQQRTFYLEVSDHLDSWPLRVRVHRANPPQPAIDDWFSLTLNLFRDGLIVEEINHNQKKWYSRKGIGDALLPEMARITGLRIYSGSNTKKEHRSEFRSVDAGKLWLRLLQEDIATYLPEEDRFLLPQHASNAEMTSSELSTPVVGMARPPRPLAVFPDVPPPVSTEIRYFRPIDSDDIKTPDDLERLLSWLYDDPDCDVHIHSEHGKPLSPVLKQARENGQLNLDKADYYYYRYPDAKSRPSYLQITPDQLGRTSDESWEEKYWRWKNAIVAVGPMYLRMTAKLTPRMQRQFEMRQAAGVQRALDRDRLSNHRRHIDDIDSFAEVRGVRPSDVASLLKNGYFDVPEDEIQRVLEEILGVPFHKKDWPGELNDLYTANVVLDGQRVETAFLLKGNGLRKHTMEIKDCGANGDQHVRLLESPARLFVLQFVGLIAENLIRDVEGKIAGLRSRGINASYCIIDGQDTARLFRAHGKA